MDEDTVENTLEILKSEIDESTEEIDRLLRRVIEVLEDEVLGRLAVESEKDELLSVEDTAKFLKSDD